jgi:peptide chain release factor 2
MKNLLQIIQSCQNKVKTLENMIPINHHKARLSEIDHIANDPKFWETPKQAKNIMKERQTLSDLIFIMRDFKEKTDFYLEYAELFPKELELLEDKISSLEEEISYFEFKQMMSEPTDDSPAILTISAGAGGLESANWVTMLLRMYTRYADANNFKVEMIDHKPSEENGSICTDSVSIRIEGKYAYGFLKSENGVHRLVRNSPFSSTDARHTSFAAVSVTPDIEDIIDIKIEDKDVEVTAQRSSGPGGQNCNKVSSSCRLKHIPTGINILVRIQRDFHANKATAFKMLKSKLYDIELKKQQEEKDRVLGMQSDNAFGSQIRSYVLSPYSLIKDTRSGYETSDSQGVLDGKIQQFIISYLKLKK